MSLLPTILGQVSIRHCIILPRGIINEITMSIISECGGEKCIAFTLSERKDCDKFIGLSFLLSQGFCLSNLPCSTKEHLSPVLAATLPFTAFGLRCVLFQGQDRGGGETFFLEA